jgi:hypothetical protein
MPCGLRYAAGALVRPYTKAGASVNHIALGRQKTHMAVQIHGLVGKNIFPELPPKVADHLTEPGACCR